MFLKMFQQAFVIFWALCAVSTACALNSSNDTSFQYNATIETTIDPYLTNDSSNASIIISVNETVVQKCDQQICEKHICRVEGTVSRPSFYARCGQEAETVGDLTNYCMCATAYHTAASNTSEPAYVPITPDINCQIPETPEDQRLCEQSRCNGLTQKLSKNVHICEVGEKYYCACFN